MDSQYGIISVGDRTGLQFIVFLGEILKYYAVCNVMDNSVTKRLDRRIKLLNKCMRICSSNVGSKWLNNFILVSE